MSLKLMIIRGKAIVSALRDGSTAANGPCAQGEIVTLRSRAVLSSALDSSNGNEAADE